MPRLKPTKLQVLLVILLLYGTHPIYAKETAVPANLSNTSFGLVDTVRFYIDYGGADTRLFEGIALKESDSGNSYILQTLGDDPHLNTFRKRLTNNVDETIYFRLHVTGDPVITQSYLESDLFGFTTENPDFSGSHMFNITFHLIDLDIDLIFYWVGFPLMYSDISLQGEIIFNIRPPSIHHIILPVLTDE
ncbi:MAG: hypothetical protein D3926_09525 [Desulfobacteraceae bacterium]|nr:MAG: hypothetical protein D3926_09525 [Desulfobacteraceae bacterium]